MTAAVRHHYGPDHDQWADLRLPAGAPPPDGHPVAVLVHGGYWRSRWHADLMEPMAADLLARGLATWNVEYRRPDRHGWDATTADVASALVALATLAALEPAGVALDLGRVVVLGHSAGGQLVTRLAADVAADPSPPVRPALTVSLAGVLDLIEGHRRWLSDGAVSQALGGTPDDVPDVYRASSPRERLPIGLPLAVVCGTQDELVDLSRTFAAAAHAAGDDVVVVEALGDHVDVIDPTSPLWPAIVRLVESAVHP